MKKWQSIINIKSMRISLVLLLVRAIILIARTMVGTTNKAMEILEQKRFVLVHNPKSINSRGDHYGKGFDLYDKKFFNPNQAAIKDNSIYGGANNSNATEFFIRMKNFEFSSALLNSNFTTDEIKKSNYQITRSPESLVNKSLLKEKYPPEFELQYIYREEDQFSKVRITYNKDFLPTKIEWYYKGEEGLKWYTWRTYSYPFKNKAEFDKRLDEEIANIEEITRENEGD